MDKAPPTHVRNCLTCALRGPARTPSFSLKPEWAATCLVDLPPQPRYCLVAFRASDVQRHLNLAPLIEGSGYFRPSWQDIPCPAWASTEPSPNLPDAPQPEPGELPDMESYEADTDEAGGIGEELQDGDRSNG